MLSLGEYHKRVPRERVQNLKWRRFVLDRCQRDHAYRAGVLLACREDVLFYINTFTWQFNPKKPANQRVGPFITWPFQEEALLDRPETTGRRGILYCIEEDQTCVVQKSREMGASWLFLIVQDWLAEFVEYTESLNISRSAEAVDSKSSKSLFWKLRFMHQYQPVWLRGEIDEQKMYFEYQRTHSSTTGEASTGRAGVGGRAKVIFIDEFSQIKEDVQVRERTAGTSDCRFFNGTHLGVDTEFFRLTQDESIAQITMHWSKHPEKIPGAYRFNPLRPTQPIIIDQAYTFPPDYPFVLDGSPTGGPYPGLRSPWYDKKAREIGSLRGVAMELDINPTGAASQFFEPLVIRELQEQYCRNADWTGELERAGEQWRLTPLAGGRLLLWLNLRVDGLPPPDEYFIGADIAEGSGATNSCLSIFSRSKGLKVGEYANPRIRPEAFAEVSVALCGLFRDADGATASLIWERQGPGLFYGKRVLEMGYYRVYVNKQDGRMPWMSKEEATVGWMPTDDTKRTLLEEYREALAGRAFINPSHIALEETLAFAYSLSGRRVYHSGELDTKDPSGAGVNHGDRVIADALAYKAGRRLAQFSKPAEKPAVAVGSLAWRRLLADNAEREDTWI